MAKAADDVIFFSIDYCGGFGLMILFSLNYSLFRIRIEVVGQVIGLKMVLFLYIEFQLCIV